MAEAVLIFTHIAIVTDFLEQRGRSVEAEKLNKASKRNRSRVFSGSGGKIYQ
jgi:hypothetical protein